MKILLLEGRDIRLVGKEMENLTIIGDGRDDISLYRIPKSPQDIAILHGHGLVKNRNSPEETANIALISEHESTIDNIKLIIAQTGAKHILLSGCHQGALIHDIERNLEDLSVGTSITILSGSKYAIMSNIARSAIRSFLEYYSKAGECINHAEIFGKMIPAYPETMLHIQIGKNVDGTKKMYAVKAVSPKNPQSYSNLPSYFTTIANNSEPKSLEKCLVTMHGSDEDQNFTDFHSSIINALNEQVQLEDLQTYKNNALTISANRGKIELTKELLEHVHDISCLEGGLDRAIAKGHEAVAKAIFTMVVAETTPEKVADNLLDCIIEYNNLQLYEQLYDKKRLDYIKCIKFYVENGVDPEVAGTDGISPLQEALSGECFEIVDIFKGISKHLMGKLDALTFIKSKFFHLLSKQSLQKQDLSKIIDAVEQNDILAAKLLLKKGADANYKNDEGTLLHKVIDIINEEEINAYPMLELLVKSGANPYIKHWRKNAFSKAKGNKQIEEILDKSKWKLENDIGDVAQLPKPELSLVEANDDNFASQILGHNHDVHNDEFAPQDLWICICSRSWLE